MPFFSRAVTQATFDGIAKLKDKEKYTREFPIPPEFFKSMFITKSGPGERNISKYVAAATVMLTLFRIDKKDDIDHFSYDSSNVKQLFSDVLKVVAAHMNWPENFVSFFDVFFHKNTLIRVNSELDNHNKKYKAASLYEKSADAKAKDSTRVVPNDFEDALKKQDKDKFDIISAWSDELLQILDDADAWKQNAMMKVIVTKNDDTTYDVSVTSASATKSHPNISKDEVLTFFPKFLGYSPTGDVEASSKVFSDAFTKEFKNLASTSFPVIDVDPEIDDKVWDEVVAGLDEKETKKEKGDKSDQSTERKTKKMKVQHEGDVLTWTEFIRTYSTMVNFEDIEERRRFVQSFKKAILEHHLNEKDEEKETIKQIMEKLGPFTSSAQPPLSLSLREKLNEICDELEKMTTAMEATAMEATAMED